MCTSPTLRKPWELHFRSAGPIMVLAALARSFALAALYGTQSGRTRQTFAWTTNPSRERDRENSDEVSQKSNIHLFH